MKTTHTPSDIEVILHFHVSPAPHPRQHAPAVQDAIIYCVDEGLLKEDIPGCYSPTPKGTAWVKMICATQYPKLAWLDTEGDIVVTEAV